MNLRQGTLLQGGKYHYRIVKKLGQGTFGITYLATTKVKVVGALGELETTIQVAVKEFFMRDINGRKENTVTCGSQSGVYEDYRRKFAREAQNLCRLHHPHIVRVLEQFAANNTYYYAMEYCEGGSLDALIAAKGGLGEKKSISYLRQIGTALSYMHEQKMLHLDLKPGNIVLSSEGDAVLIDFGLSKQFDDKGNPQTTTGIGCGTPGYAPLEQANWCEGKGLPVTMDVYAMGATLYKMLMGMAPPEASYVLNNPGCLAEDLKQRNINKRVVQVIVKAMAPQVKDRYQSINQMLAALDDTHTTLNKPTIPDYKVSKVLDNELTISDVDITHRIHQRVTKERILNSPSAHRGSTAKPGGSSKRSAERTSPKQEAQKNKTESSEVKKLRWALINTIINMLLALGLFISFAVWEGKAHTPLPNWTAGLILVGFISGYGLLINRKGLWGYVALYAPLLLTFLWALLS